jgi:hypothetical protein
VIGILFVLVLDLILRGIAPVLRGFDAFALIAVLSMVWVPGALISLSIRALRGLPIGCVALTLILEVIVAASAIIAIGCVALLFSVTHENTARLPAYFFTILGLISLRLPTELRLGAQTAMILSIAPIMLLPVLILIAPSPVAAAALVATVVGWIWTYWELSRGRHAYRQRPMVAARWRGPMG